MITIQNLKKSFNRGITPVLDGVDLSLNKGDFCVIIGANGCGKSTLLKLLSKEHKPDSGVVNTHGNVSQVCQDVESGTIAGMTLLENIVFSTIQSPQFAFYKRYKPKAIAMLKELNIGLEKYIDQPINLLSGGQRQMVATLMAINAGNDILLLDEHTSALDPKMQRQLMEYTTEQIYKLGLTTIMVTHKMDDAIKYGNRLIMMHRGKIALDVQGQEKSSLTIEDLLDMFHKYEDQNLVSGGF